MTQRRLGLVPCFLLLVAGFAAAAEPPVIRVGLVSGAELVRISTAEGALLLEDGEAGRSRVAGELIFGRRPGAAAAPLEPSTWFVDVASERDRRQALLMAEALKSTVKGELRVEKRGRRHWIVAGPYREAAPAAELQSLLTSAGMSEASLREMRPEAPPPRSRLVRVDADWQATGVAGESASIRAESGELLLDGKPYRGDLRVTLDGDGGLRVVNGVPLEAYIRGVVPEELGPDTFAELEALSAQAVAARTWVLTQLGRHEAEGYDVCPTPHCQVYGGAGAEHELSDRAVFGTVGRVLAWRGEPATAYFSSTCGGHTEPVERVFGDEPVPYLKGVPCYPETVGFTKLSGRSLDADWTRVDGTPAHDLLARLWAVGLLPDSALASGGFDRRAKSDEAANWLRAAAALAGAPVDDSALAGLDASTALGFLRGMMSALGWDARRALLGEADLAAAARFAELAGLKGEDLAAALIAQKGGLLPAGIASGWATGKLTRGNVLEVIDLWLGSRGLWEVPARRFLGREGGELVLLEKAERVSVELADEILLLSGRKGRRALPRRVLELKLSDKLRLIGPPGEPPRLLLLEEDPDGAAFDRTSVYSWWERRTGLEELARKAKARAGVAWLEDLSVKRVSSTGRVVAVELVGRGGRKTLVEGFAARGLLGLPDSRAHVEVERDADGKLVAVRATGRGWGHGVGLCQFGAYGMALAGRSHERILSHYYPGAELADLATIRLPDAPR